MYTLNARLESGGGEVVCNTYNNDYFSFTLNETLAGFTGTLMAKKAINMKEFSLSTERRFTTEDLFFANGWQSWSPSQEYRKNDTTTDYLRRPNLLRHGRKLATLYGDYAFASYGRLGVFHSWTYTYFRKSGSHFIELYGSRSEQNGFTGFEVDMQNGRFTIFKDIDGLKLEAGQQYLVFDVCRIEDEYNRTFRQYFFSFIHLRQPRMERFAGYTSWYNTEHKLNERILLRDLNGLDRVQDEVRIVQIDEGYEKAVGDWLLPNKKKFPHGLHADVERIHAKGYKAGLWLAPFCARGNSKLARQHPDWLLRDGTTGKKMLVHGGWGGAYALDIYNPEVRDYLTEVFRTVLDEWEFDAVKLDFLYAACVQPRQGKTRGQLMCEAVDFLKVLCGDKLMLGCGVPLGACWGVFDSCRIGPDASMDFHGSLRSRHMMSDEFPSTRTAIVNAIFRRGLDGCAFANDPDVFFLRHGDIKYSLPQKLLLARINDITSSALFISDNVAEYDDRELRYLRYFFREKGTRPQYAEFETEDQLKIVFAEEGEEKILRLNLKNGDSNVVECM